MSDGRHNATLMCNHKGKGQLGVTVDGTYSASSMQATLNRDTRFGTPGDVSVAAKLTGRRVGECPAKSEEDDA
jgi:hypothetical protein